MAAGLGLPKNLKLRKWLGAPLGTVGASQFGNGPAPAGFQWQFVTENGARVTEGGQPVVTLVKVN